MFTGIVKEVGQVASLKRQGDGLRIGVATKTDYFADLAIDESVNINGACQTVVKRTGNIFEVDTVEETLKKTTLGSLATGERVNLERALRPIDRMGGHIVQGHVDGVGKIESIEKLSTSWVFKISFDTAFEKLIVPIGSIAVDGISLTVAAVERTVFTVAVIPYSFAFTTLGEAAAGNAVNLEFDIVGKYIAKMLSHSNAEPSKITEDWLRGLGY